MKLPSSNHIIWPLSLVMLLIVSDSLTSLLYYKSGYDLSKDSSKTMTLVMTVLIPLVLQRLKSNSESSNEVDKKDE